MPVSIYRARAHRASAIINQASRFHFKFIGVVSYMKWDFDRFCCCLSLNDELNDTHSTYAETLNSGQCLAAASSWILRLIKWVSLAAECSIIFHLMAWKSSGSVTAWKKKLPSHFHCGRKCADKNEIQMSHIFSSIFKTDKHYSHYLCDLDSLSGHMV